MIFHDYRNGTVIVDVYTLQVRYEIRGDVAFEVTSQGRKRVTVEHAQWCIDRWREHEAKVVTATPPTKRQLWFLLIGFGLIGAFTVFAFWALLMWG